MSDVPRGRLVWYELMTSDTSAAASFYGPLTGWTTKQGPIADTPYTEWLNGETSIGGLLPLSDEMKAQHVPPNWIAYVAVSSVDDTLKQAEGLGAKTVFGPVEMPSVGRFAVIQDPQGAAISVYTAADAWPGHDEQPAPVGEFSWCELMTSDQNAAWSFYEALFGWQKTEAMDMGPMGSYQMFGRIAGRSMGGMMTKPADQPGPPAYWLYYVRVDDVDARVGQVKELGGQVVNGPMDVPGGDRIAQCVDPQGAAFAIHSTKA